MCALYLVSAVMVGPDPHLPAVTDVEPVAPDRFAAREQYRDLMKRSSRRADPDPYEIVPPLIALFHSLTDVERMSHAEKTRMRRAMKARLEQLQTRLERDVRRAERNGHESEGKTDADAIARPGSLNGPGAAGGRGQELIRLIQTTIAPDSWDINGGNGSIFFYSRLNALIIRQTDGVHRQVGTTLEQLRR